MFRGNVAVISIAVVLCVRPLYAEGDETNRIDEERNSTSNTERNGRSLHKECNNDLSPKCLKIHVLSFLEDLSSRDELNLLPGLSIVRENVTNVTSPEEMAVELARQFPGKPEEKLNRFLLYRLQNYMDGHSLRYRLLDTKTSKEALNMVKVDEESTGRKKDGGLGGKGGGGALLAAALMMKGTLAAVTLGALALLAGKALMTALISLLLSAIVGLKGGGGHKSTTYEIITKPEISHHHSHSHEEKHEYDHGHEHGHHGGYRRAYDADNYDNYNSYMPYDTTNTNSNSNYKSD